MKSLITFLIIVNILSFNLMLVAIHNKRHPPQTPPVQTFSIPAATFSPLPAPPPIKNNITTPHPGYLNYEATVRQLEEWHREAPQITEIGTYGTSTRNRPLYYLKINNPNVTGEKPKVLLTACIHGNEPLASSTMMWHVGTILKKYGEDSLLTELLDQREIYFIPVVSPDSYPGSRYIDGVDPNRDFPSFQRPKHRSIKPILALQDFFLKIKPNAVISAHTWGRVIAFPYGSSDEKCPDFDEYTRIVGEMGKLSGYRPIRLSNMYQGDGHWNVMPIERVSLAMMPIYGAEADWYYDHGAFAVVMEFGTHQRIPNRNEIDLEFNKTHTAVLLFIKEAPIVQLKNH